MTLSTITVNLFEEDGTDKYVSAYNLSSLMQGIYTLLGQYLAQNKYPSQDSQEVIGRLQTLPLPSEALKPENLYCMDIMLMGGIRDSICATDSPMVRVHFSNGLYVNYIEVISTVGSEPRKIGPFNDADYPVKFDNKMSALTRHFYHGLSELDDLEKNFKSDPRLKLYTYYCIIFLSEAVRSEYVRAYITRENTAVFGVDKVEMMSDVTWSHLRTLLDWNKRAEAAKQGTEQAIEVADREHLKILFDGYGNMYASLVRLRFMQRTSNMQHIKLADACKEYFHFDINRYDGDDHDVYPDFNKLNEEVSKATNALQQYNQTYDPKDSDTKLAIPPSEKRKTISSKINELHPQVEKRRRLFAVLLGKREATDEDKKEINENYGVDLNDKDVQEVAKDFHESIKESGFDFELALSDSVKTNTFIRKTTFKSAKYLALGMGKILPKFTKRLGTSIAKVLTEKLGAAFVGFVAAKKVPIFSIVLGTGFSIYKMVKGDFKGAAMEFASGALGAIPAVGTALSLGMDGMIVEREYSIIREKFEKISRKYQDAVTNATEYINKNESRIYDLLVEGEVDDVFQWKANPNVRFLKDN